MIQWWRWTMSRANVDEKYMSLVLWDPTTLLEQYGNGSLATIQDTGNKCCTSLVSAGDWTQGWLSTEPHPQLFFMFYFEIGSCYVLGVSLSCWGWFWTCNPPIWAFWVTRFQVYSTAPDQICYGANDSEKSSVAKSYPWFYQCFSDHMVSDQWSVINIT